VIIYVASKQATAFALGGAHPHTIATLLLRTNDQANGGEALAGYPDLKSNKT
jgi:hypothetical protein